MLNITNIPAPRVAFIDPHTGLMAREWYRFFLSLFTLTGSGQNPTSLEDLQVGPPQQDITDVIVQATQQLGPQYQDQSGDFAILYQQSQLASLMERYEVNIASLQQQVEVQPPVQIGTMGQLQQSNLPWMTFDTTPESVPTTAPGTLYWDETDGNQTLNIVMAGGLVTQQVGEEQYYRIKADSTITEGQVIMFTGTVGSSGALKGAPATGLTAGTALYVMGVATENIATNGWGYVTSFGLVRGINTTGGAEAWVDGQILYLNPTVPGGLTKTLPVAPNPKVVVAAVVKAASNGSLFIRPAFGGKLGDFEGDVNISSPVNGDLLIYDAVQGRWENATLTAGTNVSITNGAGAITISSSNPGGTVTSVGLSAPTGFSVSGSPVTSSGTLALSFAAGYSLPTTASQTNWNTAYSERLQWDGGSTNLVAATGRTSLGLGSTDTPTFERLVLNSTSSFAGVSLQKSSKNRWWMEYDGAESTGNAGSDLYFYRYDDAGAYLGNPLIISRATGLATFNSGVNLSTLTASRVVVTDASKNLASSSVTSTELGYLSGVTSAIQTQLNARLVAASNLSDLTSASTARTNLGLGSAATMTGPSGTIVGTTDTQTLTNKTISGASNTLSNIGNSSLTNSSITINGSAVSLGGSATVTATATNALTIGTGLSGTSYNGSSAVTIAIDSTVATLSGTQTLTNKTLSTALVGNATAQVNNSKMHVYNNSMGQWGLFAHGYDYAKATMLDASAGYVDFFYYGGSTSTYSGYIYASGATTSYATSSDYRLKNNPQPMTGALAQIMSLEPCTWTWKNDGKPGAGFIAHVLQKIFPDAVIGEKDQMRAVPVFDADGNKIGEKMEPLYQGVDTSFLVAPLVAAIQELKLEFDAYRAAHP